MTVIAATAALTKFNFGDAINRLVGMREKLGFSGSDSSGEYKKIPEVLKDLRSDLERAIAEDEKEYESSWSEWIRWFTDMRDYTKNRERFDANVEQDRANAWENFGKLEEILRSAQNFLDVPDKLKADASVWWDISKKAGDLTSAVPGMAQVEGWSGPAAEQYATMTGVQAQACVEYSNTAGVIYDSISRAAEYNAAVLAAVHAFMVARHRENQADIQNMVNNGWDYYRRTRAVGWRLGVLVGEIDQCYKISDGAASDTALKCDTSKERAVLTHQGWPTGVSQAGIEAGDTSAQDVAIGDARQTEAQEQKAAGDGVRR